MAKIKSNNIYDQLDYLEAVLDHFHDGIYITDKEANTVYLNHSYELISGLMVSDMLGKNMKNLVDQGVISKSGTLQVLETGEEVTLEQSFRTGKRALITSIPIYENANDRNFGILMVLTVVREITEIYSIRKELERQEQIKNMYYYELEKLRKEVNGKQDVIASDVKMQSLMGLIERIQISDIPVFLYGESGTGKANLANHIHRNSERSKFAFVRINFSVIPKNDPDSYLFGYEDRNTGHYKMGMIESAIGGTIFMDEISNMPESVQGKILMLLRDGQCVLGDGVYHKLNVRIIAGSHYSPEELRAQGRVNKAILDILTEIPLHVPPLRERKGDIIPLMEHFLKKYNSDDIKKKFDKNACIAALEYDWPGNVKELDSVVKRALIISNNKIITASDLMISDTKENDVDNLKLDAIENGEAIDLKYEVAVLESSYLGRAFRKYGNVRDAAESLGIDSSTFTRKRQKYQQMGLME